MGEIIILSHAYACVFVSPTIGYSYIMHLIQLNFSMIVCMFLTHMPLNLMTRVYLKVNKWSVFLG